MAQQLKEHPLAVAFALLQHMGDAGKYVWMTQKHMGAQVKKPFTMAQRIAYVREAIEFLREKMQDRSGIFRQAPVDFATFVQCPALLNKINVLWPEVLKAGNELNNGHYSECILTGAIGVAKSTLAIYTQAYQLYVLSCMRNPHEVFDLDPSSEIEIVFQSISKELATTVDYGRFRNMIDDSPYFQTVFPYNTELKTKMVFDRFNIVIKPVSGSDTAAIGQNVIGGIQDEVNFQAVVEDSKMNRDGTTYDQAMQNYNSIAVRRKSRFAQFGTLPGMLCLVSSRNYPGQFTDVKEAEAKRELQESGSTSIYVYDKRLWEIRPERFSFHKGVRAPAMIRRWGPDHPFWFNVFIGDATRRPRIMEEHESIADRDKNLVMAIPIEDRSSFEADLLKSLRDIAGVATLALHPFMIDTEKVSSAFGRSLSILSRVDVDFDQTKLQIYPKRFRHLDDFRFAHIDLAISKDYAGVSVGHVPEFAAITRGDYVERLPVIEFDFTLEVHPPRGGEIIFDKIRQLLYKLRELGLPIKWVSFDSFQSTDSMQILSQQNFMVGRQSMDVDTIAYEVTKTAFYDGRVRTPEHARAQKEMITLEYHAKEAYIDHPPNGSKDISDSMAGVIYGLTMRREIWVKHNVPLNAIPKTLTETESKGKRSMSYVERLRAGRRETTDA